MKILTGGTRVRRAGAAVGVGAATGLATLVVGAAPASADVTSLSGGAFGVRASVAPPVVAPIAIGPIPSVVLPAAGGGPITRTAATVGAPGVFSTDVLTATTQGDTAVSHLRTAASSARADNLVLLAGLGISAASVRSNCASNGNGSTGLSRFVRLTGVAGVGEVPLPNTVRTIPGVGTITFNEQIRTNVVGASTTIVVNAIHVRLTPALPTGIRGDIVISQSRCGAFGPDVLLPAGLPRTGGSLIQPGLAGGAMVALGAAALAATRRRRSELTD